MPTRSRGRSHRMLANRRAKMLILTVFGSMLLLGPVLVLAAGVVFVIVLVMSHG